MKPFALTLLLSTLLIANAHAGYKGEISFTAEEIAAHKAAIGTIAPTMATCLKGEVERHKYFHERIGISAFYGDQSSFAQKKVDGVIVATTKEEKRAQLRQLGFEEDLVRQLIPDVSCKIEERKCNMLQPTSCIGITNKCFGRAFEAAGQGDVWKRLKAYVKANGVAGDALLDGLQKLGWKIYYWAPDAGSLARFDQEERALYPGNPRGAWGQHVVSYRNVTTKARYGRNTVDDGQSLVNFGARTPDLIRRAPIFVGIAHLGYHVFPGSYGIITEGHSARALNDPLTVESEPFNPLAENGGPHGGPFRSGLIALPPLN